MKIPVDKSEGAAGGEEDEPEPEHQEHLLVHDVQREQAHRVKFLREISYHIIFLIHFTYVNLSDRAVGEEVTLCHLWEDLMHWINLGLARLCPNYLSSFFKVDKYEANWEQYMPEKLIWSRRVHKKAKKLI